MDGVMLFWAAALVLIFGMVTCNKNLDIRAAADCYEKTKREECFK